MESVVRTSDFGKSNAINLSQITESFEMMSVTFEGIGHYHDGYQIYAKTATYEKLCVT